MAALRALSRVAMFYVPWPRASQTCDAPHRCIAARDTPREEVNELMEEAAGSARLRGTLGINKAPTVSVDFNHDPHSATFDVTQTQVLDKRFVRVLAWYDNEWSFSNHMIEVAAYFGRFG